MSPHDLINEIWQLPDRDLIVLTGGEPFRQDFSKFVEMILDWDYDKRIQVETNGTLWLPGLSDLVTVVCSPKTPSIHLAIQERADAYKYVIQYGLVDDDGLPTKSLGLGKPARPPKGFSRKAIYVQPCDEQDDINNGLNMQTAVNSCLEHGYRLCLQTHKIAGLP